MSGRLYTTGTIAARFNTTVSIIVLLIRELSIEPACALNDLEYYTEADVSRIGERINSVMAAT